METTTQVQKANPIRDYLNSNGVQAKFKELLGEKAAGFVTSVLQTVNSSNDLSACEPASVYGAAATAAVLDLPINNNLGFAYIIAYNERQKDNSYKKVAQFQMGYKGFIQLGQRTGQYRRMAATEIYPCQIISANPLTGYEFDFTKKPEQGEKICGYASYFQLMGGFESVWYMTVEELDKHAKKYSKTYSKDSSRWKTDFDAMAKKTVLKLNISKFGPLSIQMQKAIAFDQAKINDPETEDITYLDAKEEAAETHELEDLQYLFDLKKEVLTADELADAERILTNQEINSYNKLFKLLQSK